MRALVPERRSISASHAYSAQNGQLAEAAGWKRRRRSLTPPVSTRSCLEGLTRYVAEQRASLAVFAGSATVLIGIPAVKAKGLAVGTSCSGCADLLKLYGDRLHTVCFGACPGKILHDVSHKRILLSQVLGSGGSLYRHCSTRPGRRQRRGGERGDGAYCAGRGKRNRRPRTRTARAAIGANACGQRPGGYHGCCASHV